MTTQSPLTAISLNTIRQTILEHNLQGELAVKFNANLDDVDIDEDGDVWLNDRQCWLSREQLMEFYEWITGERVVEYIG